MASEYIGRMEEHDLRACRGGDLAESEFPRLIEIRQFPDARGCLTELFRTDTLEEQGLPAPEQVLISTSFPGTLRGMHYQWPTPMGKFVTCISGAIQDIVVDVRQDSPEFGKAYQFLLKPQYAQGLWVPPGFAHGFLVASKGVPSVVAYACTALHVRENDRTICPLDYFDPAAVIQISEKDKSAFSLWSLVEHHPGCLPCTDLMS